MEQIEGTKLSGRFKLSPSAKDLHGELTLAEPKTSLYLHDSDFFKTFDPVYECVQIRPSVPQGLDPYV
jgi:hypothetical protein